MALKEFQRARSIFERAIDVDPFNISLWIRYAENEMKNKFINHARNIWERAVSILPRVEHLWSKYMEMEEILGENEKVRKIYQNWLSWNPPQSSWISCLNFEKR